MKDKLVSIDIMRGLTVASMILFHFFIEWMYWTPRDYGTFKEIIFFFGFISAPFFLIISGMAYHFYINKNINNNLPKTDIFLEIIKRSLFIFGVSTLLNIIFKYFSNKELSNIIYWSVFQVIAFSMVIYFPLTFMNKMNRRLSYIIIIIVCVFLDFIISYYRLNYLAVLNKGIFPFISWTNFYIIGLLFGDFISDWQEKRINKELLIYAMVGIMFIFSFFIWTIFYKYSYSNPSFFPFYLQMVGIFIIIFCLCYFYFDLRSKEFFIQKLITRWGKLAFSIYYIHFGVIILGKVIFPLIIEEIYSSGFLISQYVLFIIIFFLSLEIFIRIWKKHDFLFGMEWFMNKISKRTLFSKNIENKLKV